MDKGTLQKIYRTAAERFNIDYSQVRNGEFIDGTKRFTEKRLANAMKITQHWAEKQKLSQIQSDEKNATYVSSDIHGDLYVFLHNLITSGVARFKDVNNPFKVIEKQIDSKPYMVVIPNLELTNSSNKFIMDGNLTDLGDESEICLYLMEDLLKQQSQKNGKQNIVYIAGNHDGDFKRVSSDQKLGLTFDMGDRSPAYDLMENTLKDLRSKNWMQFCYYDKEKDIIYSNTQWNREFLLDMLDEAKKVSQYNNVISQYNNIIDNIKENIDDLTPYHRELLCDIINDIYKADLEFSRSGRTKIDVKDLLWNRANNFNEQVSAIGSVLAGYTPINNFKQVVGHDPDKEMSNVRQGVKNDNVLYIDMDRSRKGRGNRESIPALVKVENTNGKKFGVVIDKDPVDLEKVVGIDVGVKQPPKQPSSIKTINFDLMGAIDKYADIRQSNTKKVGKIDKEKVDNLENRLNFKPNVQVDNKKIKTNLAKKHKQKSTLRERLHNALSGAKSRLHIIHNKKHNKLHTTLKNANDIMADLEESISKPDSTIKK